MTPVRFRHLPLTLAACALLLAACASPGDGAQTIFVRTHQADGELVPGVPCVLTNKAGQWHVTAPGEVAVRRDASPLWVSCGSDSWEMASQAAQDAQGDRRSSMAKGAKMGLGIGALVGRSKANASASLSRRIGRERSTVPLRSTDQTGMVPVG